MKRISVLLVVMILLISLGACNPTAQKELREMTEALNATPTCTATTVQTSAPSANHMPPVAPNIAAFYSDPQQFIRGNLAGLPGMDDLLTNDQLFMQHTPDFVYFSYDSYSGITMIDSAIGPDEQSRYDMKLLPQADSWTVDKLGDLVGGLLDVEYQTEQMHVLDESGQESETNFMLGAGENYRGSRLYYNEGFNYGVLGLELNFGEKNHAFFDLTDDCFERDVAATHDFSDAYETTFGIRYDFNVYSNTCDVAEQPPMVGSVVKSWWLVSEEDVNALRQAMADAGFIMLTDTDLYAQGYTQLDDAYFDTLGVQVSNWGNADDPAYVISYTISFKAMF